MQTAHSILIVDSQDEARAQLRQTLAGLSGEFPHRVVGEADSAQSAIDQVASLRPSLMLVNTALTDMTGIELARRLDSSARSDAAPVNPRAARPPQVIYVSGSDRYALDAFEVRALDYLVKPVNECRLLRALSRARGPAGALPAEAGAPVGGAPQDAQALPSPHTRGPVPLLPAPATVKTVRSTARRHFAVHERGRLMLVPVDQAIYLKAELKYVTVRTRQREYLIEDSLTALEAEFGDRFVRVHRNALVCRACIAGFERVPPDERSPGADPHWQVVLRDVPERLAVSRRQWSTVRNLMG